jgi:FKBP12-rapamycin complex-associated protein
VAAKSQLVARKSAAVAILDKMRSHSAILVDQAMLVGQELIRVAILWEEMWHEGLEEASKLYFGEHNIPAMFGALEPLHQLVERGSQSVREALFIQSYGQELKEARELGNKYKQTGQSSDLNGAWDLYYQVRTAVTRPSYFLTTSNQVFRRINKSLPQLSYLDLESSSPRLLSCQNLQLAVPGTYRADQPVIRIVSVVPKIDVITSKQRPRKLIIIGSDGQEYLFLLKGKTEQKKIMMIMMIMMNY